MHSSRRMCSVIWKDKQLVLLLSTHAPPIAEGDPMICSVPRRNGEERPQIPILLVLVKYYTTKIQRVDVDNQLQGNYLWLSRSHKWWHWVFLFLWEMTTFDMYIMYLEILKKLRKSRETIIHLQFQIGLVQALTHGWKDRYNCELLDLRNKPIIHCP